MIAAVRESSKTLQPERESRPSSRINSRFTLRSPRNHASRSSRSPPSAISSSEEVPFRLHGSISPNFQRISCPFISKEIARLSAEKHPPLSRNTTRSAPVSMESISPSSRTENCHSPRSRQQMFCVGRSSKIPSSHHSRRISLGSSTEILALPRTTEFSAGVAAIFLNSFIAIFSFLSILR